ncbi:MAG: FAD-binding oxidoreductase [Candidatus Levyibacteriota bacterium]
MTYYPYIIQDKKLETEGTYIYTLKPKNGEVFSFEPGQYIFTKDPSFSDPQEAHPFSLASSPNNKEVIELCIKDYGDWTHAFSQREIGSNVFISEPQGSFVWDRHYPYAVFLLGGIGISPLISMLRTLAANREQAEIVMIYGNRTPETIAYEKEIQALAQQLAHLRVVHIFSDISEDHPWTGYRGFVTKDILEKEVDFSKKPMFYFVGPSIFIEKMRGVLISLDVPKDHRIEELLAKK